MSNRNSRNSLRKCSAFSLTKPSIVVLLGQVQQYGYVSSSSGTDHTYLSILMGVRLARLVPCLH